MTRSSAISSSHVRRLPNPARARTFWRRSPSGSGAAAQPRLEGLDQLPALSEFVPGAEVVEHLEAGLRPAPGPSLSEQLDDLEAGVPDASPEAEGDRPPLDDEG